MEKPDFKTSTDVNCFMAKLERLRKKKKWEWSREGCYAQDLYKNGNEIYIWDYPVFALFEKNLCDFDAEKQGLFKCTFKCALSKEYYFAEDARGRRGTGFSTSSRRSGYATIKGRGE